MDSQKEENEKNTRAEWEQPSIGAWGAVQLSSIELEMLQSSTTPETKRDELFENSKTESSELPMPLAITAWDPKSESYQLSMPLAVAAWGALEWSKFINQCMQHSGLPPCTYQS